MSALEEANEKLREAVAARMSATPADDPKMVGYDVTEPLPEKTPAEDSQRETYAEWVPGFQDKPAPAASIPHNWILRGEAELKGCRSRACEVRQTGDGVMNADGLRPGSREFVTILDELKSLHLAKTLDYGMDEDALSNIRNSADVVNMPAWAGCILRISDKMHRLKAFFRRGRVEFDGIEDTLKDIACYAVIALVLHREAESQAAP